MNSLIRPSDAAKKLGVSKSTLYAWMQSGHLPVRPIRLGARATAFSLDELDLWLSSRSRTAPQA